MKTKTKTKRQKDKKTKRQKDKKTKRQKDKKTKRQKDKKTKRLSNRMVSLVKSVKFCFKGNTFDEPDLSLLTYVSSLCVR
jgi:hypothetical protein